MSDSFQSGRVVGLESVNGQRTSRTPSTLRRVRFAAFIFGLVGFCASAGDLIRELLIAEENGVAPNPSLIKSLAILGGIFLIHTVLCVRSIISAHKKGLV